MNEEEIIKNVKEMIQWSDHNTYKMALQGLLYLYNKEKEKNIQTLEYIEREEINSIGTPFTYTQIGKNIRRNNRLFKRNNSRN